MLHYHRSSSSAFAVAVRQPLFGVAMSNNNRQHLRIDFVSGVEIVVAGAAQGARTVNISQGGVFIETPQPPALDAKVVLRIALPGVPETCAIPCIVRWGKGDEGVGLQFENLRAIEVWAINKLLKTLQQK
jgi:hypothetical protein